MFLTIFYMIATWVQSWRLSSLRARFQSILQDSETLKPSIMFYNPNKSLVKNGDANHVNILSSHLCCNSIDGKLGDLIWYQGNQQLYTIYPQQKVDVSNWLLFPRGKTIFPLFSHNNAETSLLQNAKIYLLIETELQYYQYGSVTATKLEDYGLIITWITDNNFGVILETDLDHITRFFTTIMQGQLFINNGLYINRVASISITGDPCSCNYEKFNLLESSKIISCSQWPSYVNKLKQISQMAKSMSQQFPEKINETHGMELILEDPASILELPKINESTLAETSENNTISTAMTNLSIMSTTLNNTTDEELSQDSNHSINSTLLNSPGELPANSSHSEVKKSPLQESLEENFTDIDITSRRHSLPDNNEIGDNNAKRPNILICADSAIVNDNVCSVLRTTLKENKYAIYPLSMQDAQKDMWMEQTNLIIVCGNVEPDVASQVVEFIVRGGKLLALCSDILKIFIPAFKTAEIRENELVRFSYGKWKYVCLLHHIFCYQASPVKTKFSQDLEESKPPASPIPVSTNICDQSGKKHTFDLKILGSEETWHTPCILFANQLESGGQAVFSQIHLEVDPYQYEFEENKFTTLKDSNATRLEIFSDILSTHLGIEVDSQPKMNYTYSSGFFLGRHELKLEMMQRLKDILHPNDVLKTSKLEIQFCNTSAITKPASSAFLPVFIHRCPENFSTVTYFENLNTKEIGRLVIYADVMTSSNYVVNGLALHHGLAVIPYQQTKGQGRGDNVWLSPKGCAMFTLQLHIPIRSVLGDKISLIQYLTSLAIINAVKLKPGYQDINMKIKWPNDIYTGNTKIGGILVTSFIQSSNIICNIGVGINLSNTSPTTCINDIITKYNESSKLKLQQLPYEEFLARVFSEIESLLNIVQNGNLDHMYDQYYKNWMHTNAEIKVILPDNSLQKVKILGIDHYGFLEVKGTNGKKFTVHPDGNSFDILKGLIVPKY